MTRHFARTTLGLTLALIFAASPLTTLASATQARPNFTGTWRLNREQSGEPHNVFISRIRGEDKAPGMTGTDATVMPAPVPSHIPLPIPDETLKIAHNEPQITIAPILPGTDMMIRREHGALSPPPSSADQPVRTRLFFLAERTFYTDERKTTENVEGDNTVEQTARWDGDTLVTEVKTNHGMNVTDTYALTPDGRQMVVVTRIRNEEVHQQPIIIRRVYDAVDSD